MKQPVSKPAFEARIEASRKSVTALSELELELQSIPAPWAGPMRIKVINIRRQLRHSNTQPAPWLMRYGLPSPDGRPLYRYPITTEISTLLTNDLKNRARIGRLNRRDDEALFVFWAAEWFRRSYHGGQRRWEDIGKELGLKLSQAEWRGLTDQGLAHWGLRPLRLNGVTHRLLNLARQGGFPVAAIEEEAGGWAGAYLTRLVGVLLAETAPTADIAFEHAKALAGPVPAGWCHDDLFVVSADLALSIVRLRREAEAGGLLAGLPASTWLDSHRPEWREQLPLGLSTESSRRLIDGLMKAAVVRGGSGAVQVKRIFRYSKGCWEPALRFELNGRLRGARLATLDSTWSRLRMYATGNLARYVSGELAVLEPGENGEWVVAASRTLAQFNVPLETAAEVELRGGGSQVGPTVVLGQGGSVRGSLLVCRSTEDIGDDLPQELELVGTTAGQFRSDPLYVLLPANWKAEGIEDGEEATSLGDAGADRALWRISKGAIVSSDTADRYRLLAGQTREDQDAIVLTGPPPPSLSSVDGYPVYLGMPRVSVRHRGREEPAPRQEIWWRCATERDWHQLGQVELCGIYEFAWRDATGLIRDRQAAVILPSDFRFSVQRAGDHNEVRLLGWTGFAQVQPGFRINENNWRVGAVGADEAHVMLRLDSQMGPPIRLEAWLPHKAWLCDWEGQALPPRSRIALSDLHRLVARATGRCELTAQLLDHRNRRVPQADMRWSFERELPLSTLADDLSALLRPLGDLDARVELSFNETAGILWYACELDICLASEPRGLVPSKAIAESSADVVGRSLHEPQTEQLLQAYDLNNHRPIALPPLEGSWLIYLKVNQRAVTRPYLATGTRLRCKPESLLGQIMTMDNRFERQAALESLPQRIDSEDEETGGLIRSTIALATTLEGLPPSTFDIFQTVAGCPLFATRLLFEASEQDLHTLLMLETALPFAWWLIPQRVWNRAAELRYKRLLTALPAELPERDALALGAIVTARARVAALEPVLAPLLNQSVSAPTLKDAAQSFMQRAHDRVDPSALNPFRPQMACQLPGWNFDEGFWRALDAPCAAARAAREEVSLDAGQLRCVKDIARRHPRYFRAAYVAAFRELPHA